MTDARNILLHRLSEQGEKGVTVTVDMVRQEMCKSAVTYMLSKVSVNLLATGMQRFHDIIQHRNDQWALAAEHRRKIVLRSILHAWRHWAYISITQSDEFQHRKQLASFDEDLFDCNLSLTSPVLLPIASVTVLFIACVHCSSMYWKQARSLYAHYIVTLLSIPTPQLSTYRGGLGTRYNALRVERFARIHCLRSAYFAWRALAKRLGRGTKMQRRVLTRLLRVVFHEWAVEAKRSCKLRIRYYCYTLLLTYCNTKQQTLTLHTWTDHSLKELGVPFRMWYIYTSRQKRLALDQERLVTLYRRTRARRTVWRILHAWHHQSVYGRVEGLYTRPQLITSLAEEREHVIALTDQAKQLAESLQDMEAMSMDYRRQAMARAREVRLSEANVAKVSMALHHAEQDVVRMQSLLDAAATISPPVLTAVLRMAPGFDFQERGLTQWARQRAETVAQDDEAKFQQRLQAYLAENNLPAATLTAATAATTDTTNTSDNGTPSVVDSNKAVSGWNVRLKQSGSSSPKSRSISSRESVLVAAGSAGAAATTVPKADASTQ
eukprot:11861-Heterococcus_DN1.PRE.1